MIHINERAKLFSCKHFKILDFLNHSRSFDTMLRNSLRFYLKIEIVFMTMKGLSFAFNKNIICPKFCVKTFCIGTDA